MSDIEHDPKALTDLVLQRALVLIKRQGVPDDIAVDRITTFAAGTHVQLVGSAGAAACFRAYADRIEQGLFTAQPGEGGRPN